MGKFIFITVAICVCFCFASTKLKACDFCKPKKANLDKPGIILVAFGTSVPEARKVFDYIDKSAKKNFPGHDIEWGFTARSIVKKLRKEGTDKGVLTLEEAIAAMKKAGHKTIVMQSFHVVPGQKHKELLEVKTGIKTIIGAPLLSTNKDMQAALKAISKDIKKNCPNIIAGHGNDHHPELNAQLVKFNKLVERKFKDTTLCTVEGKPGTGKLEPMKKKIKNANGKVNFIPMMIVAGDHIMNDVNGDEDDAWKKIVKAKQVTVAKPLGYNDDILAIYWSHLKEAVDSAK
jgi:sirohydrochlorin cobaltochelatase